MEEKYLAAKEKLAKYNQEHLLNNYEKISEEKKVKLLDQILTIDYAQINELFQQTKHEVDFSNDIIEPIEYIDKSELSNEEKNKFDKIGIEKINAGKYAVVTMAGGQGTRLGHNGPKGTYDIGLDSHKAIFELLIYTLK